MAHMGASILLTPVALKGSRQVLCLPMYGELSEETVDRICDIILRCRR